MISSSTCTSITNEGYDKDRVVVGLLGGDLDVGIGWGTQLDKDALSLGTNIIEKAAQELGVRVSEMDRKKYGAIVIDDGSRMKKEELLLGVLEKNQSLIVAGGGAKVEQHGKPGWMGVDGEVFTDGALALLFHTDAPWAASRYHSYQPLGKRVRITKIDEVRNRIVEFDGEPAAQRWAKLLGVPSEHLTFECLTEVIKWGLALRVGNEYFMRALQKAQDSNELMTSHWIQEGQEFELMREVDTATDTREFLSNTIRGRVSNPTCALFFDCTARKMVADIKGETGALSAAFSAAPPCLGAIVYYESYCSFMVGGTLTSFVFGEN